MLDGEKRKREDPMTILTSRDPKALVAELLTVLREYAERVLLRNRPLDAPQQTDARGRMTELFAIGSSFKLTDRDMVVLVYAGLFPEPARPSCGCAACQARHGNRG